MTEDGEGGDSGLLQTSLWEPSIPHTKEESTRPNYLLKTSQAHLHSHVTIIFQHELVWCRSLFKRSCHFRISQENPTLLFTPSRGIWSTCMWDALVDLCVALSSVSCLSTLSLHACALVDPWVPMASLILSPAPPMQFLCKHWHLHLETSSPDRRPHMITSEHHRCPSYCAVFSDRWGFVLITFESIAKITFKIDP